jgi:hypothetical protein
MKSNDDEKYAYDIYLRSACNFLTWVAIIAGVVGLGLSSYLYFGV